MDNNITLMDCPGVILDDEVEESEAALRNAIKIDQLQDPVGVIEALLKKVKKEQLMEIFHIPNFGNAVEFLSYVAQKRGKLKHVSFFRFKTFKSGFEIQFLFNYAVH